MVRFAETILPASCLKPTPRDTRFGKRLHDLVPPFLFGYSLSFRTRRIWALSILRCCTLVTLYPPRLVVSRDAPFDAWRLPFDSVAGLSAPPFSAQAAKGLARARLREQLLVLSGLSFLDELCAVCVTFNAQSSYALALFSDSVDQSLFHSTWLSFPLPVAASVSHCAELNDSCKVQERSVSLYCTIDVRLLTLVSCPSVELSAAASLGYRPQECSFGIDAWLVTGPDVFILAQSLVLHDARALFGLPQLGNFFCALCPFGPWVALVGVLLGFSADCHIPHRAASLCACNRGQPWDTCSGLAGRACNAGVDRHRGCPRSGKSPARLLPFGDSQNSPLQLCIAAQRPGNRIAGVVSKGTSCRFRFVVVVLRLLMRWDNNPFRAFRFGEALHPGPSPSPPQVARVAIVNPTAIHCKEPDFLELGADLIAISETSAVEKVQQGFAKGMRPHGYHLFYSSPVDPHGRDVAVTTSVRGLAGGTAIATRLGPSFASPFCTACCSNYETGGGFYAVWLFGSSLLLRLWGPIFP